MADYDWGPACGCGFMQPHRDLCQDNPNYDYNVRKYALIEKYDGHGYGLIKWPNLWSCHRCGNVVWDPELHSQFFAAHADIQHPADKIKKEILNG